MNWEIQQTDEFARAFKKLGSDHRLAIGYNLEIYLNSLNSCKNPLHISLGFLHSESKGMRAIDQTGGAFPDGRKRPKMAEIRVYTYSNLKSRTLHLLWIGGKRNKREQNVDNRIAGELLEKILNQP